MLVHTGDRKSRLYPIKAADAYTRCTSRMVPTTQEILA